MLFRQLFDVTSCTYTYLLSLGKRQEAILIDPVKENTEQYLKLLHELNLTLVAVLETHLHADHVTASGMLREALGCKIMMGEQTKAQGVSYFKDNQVLAFDELKIKTIYTPGHTDDSYCFLVDNCLFTGDTLFIRGTGRTDFQQGGSGMQYDSLFHKILRLPRETRVYPGHDYKGMTMSTIGEEIDYNPRLQIKTMAEYQHLMDTLNLPYPKLIDVAIPLNQNCGLAKSP